MKLLFRTVTPLHARSHLRQSTILFHNIHSVLTCNLENKLNLCGFVCSCGTPHLENTVTETFRKLSQTNSAE